jgi:hypothetical protein
MSFLGQLESIRAECRKRDVDPWLPTLERLRGETGPDGVERVTTQWTFDVLGVRQSERTAGACRRLARLMAELGWTAVRVRGLTRGGYLEQVRGYCRNGEGYVR